MRPLLLSIPLVACLLTAGCQTPPSAKSAKTPSIAGTTWRGTEDRGEWFVCEFERSGRLHYNGPTGEFRNGTWRQTDAAVYMETNKRYAEYFGTIDGSHMSGSAKNVVHKHWTWDVRKSK